MSVNDARFGVFKVMKIQVEFFCVVTPCSVAVGYESFGGTFCFHLQATLRGIETQEIST
jgi:hypothetical protein